MLACFSSIAFSQSADYQLNKGTFIFSSAYYAAHSFDLVSHDQSSGEDSGAYQNYVSKLEDEGLAKYCRESKIVNIFDIMKHHIPYKDTYITVEFVKIGEKSGKELGWVNKSDLTKLKKKK